MAVNEDYFPGFYPVGQKKPDWTTEDGKENEESLWAKPNSAPDAVVWTQTDGDKGINPEIRKLPISALIEKGAELLQELEGRTGYFRQVAEVIVALRIKNKRDLAGRSGEYRKAVRRMYERAGIPRATESNVSAAIRYHVRKLVWDEATSDEKRKLKLTSPYKPAEDAARPAPESGTGNGQEGAQAEGEVGAVDEPDITTLNPLLLASTLKSQAEQLQRVTVKTVESGTEVDLTQLRGFVQGVLNIMVEVMNFLDQSGIEGVGVKYGDEPTIEEPPEQERETA